MKYCYASSLKTFLKLRKDEWLRTMRKNYKIMLNEYPSQEQNMAWDDCYEKTIPFFKLCINFDFSIIFEYYLPREGGRRPDVLILSGNRLFVLEYKMKNRFSQVDIDQVSAYSRDLQHYHKKSRDLKITSFLVLTGTTGKFYEYNDVYVCSTDKLKELILPYLSNHSKINLSDWLEGVYQPLPSLIEGAKSIYNNENLPYIHKVNSVGIPEAVSGLIEVVGHAKMKRKRILALVTGVPGAGKTLLGLDFVHKTDNGTDQRSIFLSGNGPLVKVLQYSLKSKTFVAPLRNYVLEYGIRKDSLPEEHIVVFDEAQRAWDKSYVHEKHNIDKSQPELILEIAEEIPEWSVVLGLIGEGQEINKGEETGIIQWKDAILKSGEDWTIICPQKLRNMFQDVGVVITLDKLNLNVSLRSHLAENVSDWVTNLLQNNIEKSFSLSETIHSQGFNMYITRDLNNAKNYCLTRYDNNPVKRYGLVCSSKSRILRKYGIDNSYTTSTNLNVGAWYNEPNENIYSCCQLKKPVTEFSCQGLELDMPIVCWGEDLLWVENMWKSFQRSSKLKDPHQIRLNSYRVLLTRGRDGFIVYIPKNQKLDDTYEILKQAGLKEL